MSPTLETARFILRKPEEQDAQGFFDLDSDPEVHKYLGNNPIKTMDQAHDTIAYVRNQYDQYGIGRWAVIDKATQDFVGWSGLKFETTVRTDMDYYDLGYRLRRQYWGQGIATETSLAALEYGFETLKLEEIFAGAHVDNIGSNKVLQKVGLRLIEVFEFDGDEHNWYGISKSEWLEKKHA
ncbi:GNAT family N-acetyltransferase [Phaeodactylibacter xiamenensis]|uniref:GNAT family N-acetyltransferase n=1 Tax=Phaeodactylibacter xiamenensis TaxID=1524460 RepID=UPI003BABC4F5